MINYRKWFNHRKWIKHLINRFGRDIRMWALVDTSCPCWFFERQCYKCVHSRRDEAGVYHWCVEAEKFYSVRGIETIKIKQKILRKLS